MTLVSGEMTLGRLDSIDWLPERKVGLFPEYRLVIESSPSPLTLLNNQGAGIFQSVTRLRVTLTELPVSYRTKSD